ncbi:hypothetical protein JCM10212_001045 [Sporobolomyces blumeae]
MSASLARTVFRPAVAAPARVASTSTSTSSCPARHFFPSGASSPPSTGQRRTFNLVAHTVVLSAVVASVLYDLAHPDALMFDHPPRSAIGWVPAKHMASREHHLSTSSTMGPHHLS